MSAIGPKRTSLVAPHMSAFGRKADMTLCGNPLLRSLLGVKRTCLFAAPMSASDPKRTSSPAKNQAHLKEKSNSSSSLLSVRRLSAVGRYNARHCQPSQNCRQLYQHLKKMGATSCKTETIVPTNTRAGQRSSDWQGTERSNDAETIATLWLVFYMLALGVAISSPFISRAIEFAALTAQ
jgi:hypothetical protein